MTIENTRLLSPLLDSRLLSACLICLNTFLLLFISVHHTQYRKSHLRLDLSIYATLLKIVSKLDNLVFFYFGFSHFSNVRIYRSKFLHGGWANVCRPLSGEVKVKNLFFFFFLSFQTKEGKKHHLCKQRECQTAWKSLAEKQPRSWRRVATAAW